MNTPIHQWPETERPRERLLSGGAAALSDAELLALVLRHGSRNAGAIELAHALLARFGSLRGTLDAPPGQLREQHGVGPGHCAALHACAEIGRRYLASRIRRGAPLDGPDGVRRFLESRLRHYRYEVFACLFLDNRHRVIRFDELFRGTIDGASVHPREVVRQALEHNAAALILAHNHPSGVAEPSHADRALTRRLREATALVDVRLLDHFVVGDGEVVSFAERGWL